MIVAIALLVAAVSALAQVGVAGQQAASQRIRVQELAIVRNMTMLSTDVLDELNAAVLADYGIEHGPSPDPDARAAMVNDLRRSLDGFEPSGLQAAGFVATTDRWLDDVEAADPENTDFRLYWSLSTAGLEGADRVSGESSIVAVVRLAEASVFPRILLNSALDAELALDPPADPAQNRVGYYADAASWIASDASQLVDDQAALPSWVFDGDSHFEAELEATERSVAASDLPGYDRWIASLADGAEPIARPMGLSAHAVQTATLSQSFDAALARTFDDERLTFEAAAGRAERDRRLYLGGGIGGLGLGLGLLVPSAGEMIRRRRRLAKAVQTDPLTGAANRRALDTVVPNLLGDRSFVDHRIGVIDLDKFKLINDSYGHPAGDTVLCEFVRRMERALLMWAAEDDVKRRGQLVRLGGDEFVLSLHSANPIDPLRLEGLIRATVEHPVRLDDGAELPLAFSIGLARCDGPDELGSAQAAADLAAYENKRDRSGGPSRPPRQVPGQPPGQREDEPGRVNLIEAGAATDEITLTS